jgi:hypothetical protein
MRVEPENIKERNTKLVLLLQKNAAIMLVLVSLVFYFVKILFL